MARQGIWLGRVSKTLYETGSRSPVPLRVACSLFSFDLSILLVSRLEMLGFHNPYRPRAESFWSCEYRNLAVHGLGDLAVALTNVKLASG